MLDTARSKVSKPRITKTKKAKFTIPASTAAKAVSSSSVSPKPTQQTKSAKATNQSHHSSSSPPHPPATQPTMPSPPTPEPLPSLRDLASSNPTLRRTALTTLLTHLDSRPASHPLTSTQAQQLWRAFYVALYMHDSKSAISVQNLARTLAGVARGMWAKDQELDQAATEAEGGRRGEEGERWTWSRTWADAFWGEMAREWVGVDQWRMNKVLMLVRMVVGEGFALAVESAASAMSVGGDGGGGGGGEDDDGSRDYVAEVVALPLELQRSLPDGLRMHVLDVWGDELEKLVAEKEGDGEDKGAGKQRLIANTLVQAAKELSVFRQGEANVPKNVRARAKEVVQRYGTQ